MLCLSDAKMAFYTLLTSHHGHMCMDVKIGFMLDTLVPSGSKNLEQKSFTKEEACLGKEPGDRVENQQKELVVSRIGHLSVIGSPKANIKSSHLLRIRVR